MEWTLRDPKGPSMTLLCLRRDGGVCGFPSCLSLFTEKRSSRIEDTLEPSLSDGRLFVHPRMERAHEEGKEFPTGFLDCLDCMAAAKRMLPKRATTKTKMMEREREIDSLKRAGMPFGTIMERLNQKFGKQQQFGR